MSGGISIEVGWVTIHSARKVYLSLDRHLAVKRALLTSKLLPLGGIVNQRDADFTPLWFTPGNDP